MDLWGWIHEERRGLADTFATLTPEQWDTPSLCSSWTVKQLLGHLVVATDPRLRPFLGPVFRARGDFNKANDQMARDAAECPVDELLATYRECLSRRGTPPGFGAEAPLSDVMLHSLDARVPLGLPTERPVERWKPVLDVSFSRRAVLGFVPRGRPKLRWVATDFEWSHGQGDAVEGTMADLALAATGRGARIDALTGPGQAAVAAWLDR